MRYNKVVNADKIVNSSSYLIKNPEMYKNKWRNVFGNNNPICIELGMGRGSFIIGMAKKYPGPGRQKGRSSGRSIEAEKRARY